MNWFNNLYHILGIPFGYLMWGIYSIIKNYGISIIVFTLITRLVLFPVSFKQQKNMAQSRVLAPKMAALKKAYANNPQRLQEEQMKLQMEEGMNPMASCLPAIIQMLLLFGVLDVVYRPLTHILRFSKDTIAVAKNIIIDHEPDFFKSAGLREELKIMTQVGNHKDWFSSLSGFTDKIGSFKNTFLGIDLGKIPEFKPEHWSGAAFALFMIPILSGVFQLVLTIYTQVYQKKNNPDMPSMGAMSIMIYIMPVFSVWFAFQVPAGVGFYWIISTLIAIVQTVALNAYFTSERIAEVAAKEKEKSKKKKSGGFMQKMLEQQQLNNGTSAGTSAANRINYSDETSNMSRSELNAYNKERIREARKRMAEKYGDDYRDDND